MFSPSRIRAGVAAALALLIMVLAPAFADEAQDRAELDRLFALLRVAPDAQAAADIDSRIWQVWTAPSDPVLAARMAEVTLARMSFDIGGAIRLLDQLVFDFPDYAEGWNARATLHYMRNDFEASLADIDRVLELEPRHFGALSGRSMIYLATGQRSLALRDMVTALQYHPFLSGKQAFPELLDNVTNI